MVTRKDTIREFPAAACWSHERAGRMLAGLSVLACALLAWLHHPAWLLGIGGTALNLVISAITDKCVVKNLLIRIGLPGERDLGRAEASEALIASEDFGFASGLSAGMREGRRNRPVEVAGEKTDLPLRVQRN